MFTGIVEEKGSVVSVDLLADAAARLVIQAPIATSDAQLGASICVSGVCLTVAELDGTRFVADVMKPTIDATTVGSFQPGRSVNIERATTPATRLGGHIVTGHVDCVGAIVGRITSTHWETLRVTVPNAQWQQIARKGSVAIDGTSLTVGDIGGGNDEGHWFEVSLIPTTLAETTLGAVGVGDEVNIETDVLAKYVQRLAESDKYR